MTKHRKTKRRSQKGGLFGFFEGSDTTPSYGEKKAWYNPTGWFESSNSQSDSIITQVDTSIGNGATNAINAAKSGMDAVSNSVSNAMESLTSPSDTTQYQTTQYQTTPLGGKRKRYSRTMKGGKGDLGLTYYATPVSGIKVVEPNTWLLYNNGTNQCSIKGGSRKRRAHRRKTKKNRQTRRHKKH